MNREESVALAMNGSTFLIGYAVLLAVASAATTNLDSIDDARQQNVVYTSARALLHGSCMLLVCAAGLQGSLPGPKNRARCVHHQRHLPTVALACLGFGFLWRASRIYCTSRAPRSDVETAAVGMFVFLGALAVLLAATRSLAAAVCSVTPRLSSRTSIKSRPLDFPGAKNRISQLE